MRVSRYDFDPKMSQDTVDEIVNGLLVNLDVFSRIACTDGMAYGVKTMCTTCNIIFNQCARSHLVKGLAAAQSKAEGVLGYPVTEQFHYYEQFWNGEKIIRLKPGITGVNVRREYGPATSYAISPYIQTDIPMEDSGSGFCIATLDSSVVEDPLKIILRNDAKDIFKTVETNGYPRFDEDENWVVAVKGGNSPACDNGPLHAQHCEYMTLVVLDEAAIACEEGSTVYPFYPESHQIIPYAKDPEAVEGGTRYWFYAWALLNSAFKDEGADLYTGQFERLLQKIDFRCVTEVETAPQIVWLEKVDCKLTYTTDDDLAVQILDAVDGTVMVDAAAFRCTSCGSVPDVCTCPRKDPLKIRIYYKVSPEVMHFRGDMEYVRQAISYLAAAELPDKACRCDFGKEGFIAEAKEQYNKIITSPGGVTTIQLKYGTKYGQLTFGEKLKDVPKIYTPIHL